jgi:mRNA interferase YafQ
MRKIRTSTKYKKDLKLALKNKTFKIETLNEVIRKLSMDEPLDKKYNDHPLHGIYKNYRDCHIHPDWVLIYSKIDDNELKILDLIRIGSHSNLFGF